MVIDRITPVEPEHYKSGDKEAKDLIKEFLDFLELDGYEGFLMGNVLKYLARYNRKGQRTSDLAKAQTYIEFLK